MHEKRAMERFTLELPVNIIKEDKVIEGALTRDISSHGVFVLTPDPLETDSRVHLEIELPFRNTRKGSGKNLLKAEGKVVRNEAGGMAVLFDSRGIDYPGIQVRNNRIRGV